MIFVLMLQLYIHKYNLTSPGGPVFGFVVRSPSMSSTSQTIWNIQFQTKIWN